MVDCSRANAEELSARDGTPKLMEINPRLGSHTWYTTAMGSRYAFDVPAQFPRRTGGAGKRTILTRPCCWSLSRISSASFFNLADRGAYHVQRLLGKKSGDADAVPASVLDTLDALRRDYFGKHRKVYMPQFRCGLGDPMVFLLKSWAVLRYELKQLKRIGI